MFDGRLFAGQIEAGATVAQFENFRYYADMWSLIQEMIKDIDSLIRKPYLPSKQGLDEIQRSMEKYSKHCDKQSELTRLLAEAYCNVAQAEKNGASSEEVNRLQEVERLRVSDFAQSELVGDALRLESSLIAWRVYGKKRTRLVKILEGAKQDRISVPLSHDANLLLELEEVMASHQKEKVEKLRLLLEAFDEETD